MTIEVIDSYRHIILLFLICEPNLIHRPIRSIRNIIFISAILGIFFYSHRPVTIKFNTKSNNLSSGPEAEAPD